MKIRILMIIICTIILISGCSNNKQETIQIEPLDDNILLKSTSTPSEGIMGGINTVYIIYKNGSYQHLQQNEVVNSYDISLSVEELQKINQMIDQKSYTIKSEYTPENSILINDNGKTINIISNQVVSEVISSIYSQELEKWKEKKFSNETGS